MKTREVSRGKIVRPSLFSAQSATRKATLPASPLPNKRKCSDREGGSALDGRRNGKEAKALSGQRFQSSQVLDDGDVRREQDGMRRTGAVIHVVNVGAVDADQTRTGLDQCVAALRCEER